MTSSSMMNNGARLDDIFNELIMTTKLVDQVFPPVSNNSYN